MSIESILRRLELDSSAIDKECSSDHLLEISRFLEKWELVSSFLGLKPQNIEEVKHDSNNNLPLMRLKMLQKWHSLYAFNATYRELVNALLKSGLANQATQVCRFLCSDKQHGIVNSVP